MLRRLLMIALDWTRPKDPPLSLGHASIFANLIRHKIDVQARSWAVNAPGFDPKQVTDFIMQQPSASDVDVAFGTFVWNEHAIQSILADLKRYQFSGRVILGGPQISYVKKGLEQLYAPPATVFVRGYAEDALASLMKSTDPLAVIKGIHHAGEPDLSLVANAAFEQLPSPFLEGYILPQPFIRWETQRGCPFRCSFCQHREPEKILRERKYFPAARISAETQWIKLHPVIQDIAVLDPTFNSGPNYLGILQQMEGYTGKLSLQVRIEMITPEFINAIEKINVTGQVVLELGLQTIHKAEFSLIGRPNNMKKIDEILDELQRRKITTEISLIFGLPGQTYESFKSSVEYCMKKGVLTIHAFPLMLLRGTPLHDQKDRFGLVESNEIASAAIPRQQHHIPHVVGSQSFSYEEWRKMAALAEWLEVDYNLPKKP